jgi:hypothetical protein
MVGLSARLAYKNNSYSEIDYRLFSLEDDYYQIDDFTNLDTQILRDLKEVHFHTK